MTIVKREDSAFLVRVEGFDLEAFFILLWLR